MMTHRNSHTEIPNKRNPPVKPRQARPKTTRKGVSHQPPVLLNVYGSSSDTKDKPCLIYYMNDKPDDLTCGACNTPATKSKCKYFCDRCDVFICQKCEYHLSLADSYDDDEIHSTDVTVGSYARTVAETTKKRLEELSLLCENIKNAKQEYRDYLEHCVSKCKRGKEIFQKAINEINYDLGRLHELGEKLQQHFDELKAFYKNRNVVAVIRKRHSWKDFESLLKEVESSHKPHVWMNENREYENQYPAVVLEQYCLFRGIKNQDIRPEKVKRAWILHAGELYVNRGGYDFWSDYYKSQIRPFVTLADNKEEVLVYLMQISGFVGEWSKNDIEMSGQPYYNGTNTDKFGSSFILDNKNSVYIHRGSHVMKVELPVNGRSEYYSPIILCVDPERELLCVYTKDTNYYNEEVYVYKIRYTFQPPYNREDEDSKEPSSDEDETIEEASDEEGLSEEANQSVDSRTKSENQLVKFTTDTENSRHCSSLSVPDFTKSKTDKDDRCLEALRTEKPERTQSKQTNSLFSSCSIN